MRLGVFAHVNVFLVIVMVGALHAASPSSSDEQTELISLVELQKSWSPGDRIVCRLKGCVGVCGSNHHMIVVDQENVIHARKRASGQHYVSVDPVEKYRSRPNMQECRNKGPGRLGREEAIKRAREWDSTKPIYFSYLSCNCRHYVNHWADGWEVILCPSYLPDWHFVWKCD